MPQDLNITAAELAESAAGGNDAALALLAGRMVASVKSLKTGEHITVQAKCSLRNADTGRWETVPFDQATHVYLDVPGTGDRYRRNDKIGTYYPAGKQAGKLWGDSAADGARVWAALFALSFAAGRPVSPRGEFVLGTNCLRCGRELMHPDSVRRNLGEDCAQVANGGQHQVKNIASAAPSAALPPSEALTGPGARLAPSSAVSGPEDGWDEDPEARMLRLEMEAEAATVLSDEDRLSSDLTFGGLIEYRPGRSAREQLAQNRRA